MGVATRTRSAQPGVRVGSPSANQKIQGYYFSRLLSASKFETFMLAQHQT